jgi:prepilin-type N-terminal cleavage/methylation domain-containing protein
MALKPRVFLLHNLAASPTGRRAARPAFTLMELTIAVAVFAVLLASSTKMIMVASKQARANERRLVALQTVQAITEQIGNIPWDNLPTEAEKQFPLPEAAVAHLSGAELKVTVHDEVEPVAKRIAVELTWQGNGANRAGPVRLTSWVFPENAQATP